MKHPGKSPREKYLPIFTPVLASDLREVTPKIMVVDDDDGVREAMKEFLKSLGYQVFSSPDAYQAIEIIRGQFIHLAILDLYLPGMDGIELQKKIHEISPDSMQIIITGYESIDSAIETLKAGAYDYLSKPVRLSDLKKIVQNCLEKQRLELENRYLLEELSQTCEQLREREDALLAKTKEADYYLQNILEKANDIIFTLDMDGNFTYLNPKIETLGYKREMLMGSSFFSLLSRKVEASLIYRSIKMGKSREWDIYIRDKAGKDRHMIISTSPIHDGYSCLTGALGIAMDITNQEALSQISENRDGSAGQIEKTGDAGAYDHNQRILSRIPVGLLLFDAEGRALQANQTLFDLCSIDDKKVAGKTVSSCLPKDIWKKIAPAMEKAVADGVSSKKTIEISVNSGDGGERILGARIMMIKEPDGSHGSGLLVIDDLTRARRMERELLRLERVDSMLQLATGVAHEIRNPLSIILGSVQYLRSIIDDNEKSVTEHLEVMGESCELLGSIVNELLNFARPASMVFRLGDINACVKRTVSLLGRVFEEKKIDVCLNLDPKLPFTACDEQHLGQVFINLIINAVHAMPDKGRLTIETRDDPLRHGILIGFQDNGIGMDKERLKRIFEPFYTTKSKGIGLGLAYTKRIVEDHYGRIWVKSRPGEGSEFMVLLPYRAEETKGKGRRGV